MQVTVNGKFVTDDPRRVTLAIPRGTGELARAARTIYRMVSDGASWTDGQGDTTITMSPRDLVRLANLLEGRTQPTVWRRVDTDAHPRWVIGEPGDGSRYAVITDEVIRTYGRRHVERVLLNGLPPLPEHAWEVSR